MGKKQRNEPLAAFPIDLIEAGDKRAIEVENAGNGVSLN